MFVSLLLSFFIFFNLILGEDNDINPEWHNFWNHQPLIKIFEKTSGVIDHPSDEVCVGSGYKLICGGARDNWRGSGNLLTASYPKNNKCWIGKGKDHKWSDRASITVFAVGIYDPYDLIDIRIWQRTGNYAAHPSSSVNVGPGYTMLCGGARDNWSGAGNLLTASYPSSPSQWIVKGKDHLIGSPATITAFAIGAKLKNGHSFHSRFQLHLNSGISAKAAHPSITVSGQPKSNGWYTYGGGAFVHWTGWGNLLTAAYPSNSLDSYICKSKDHGRSSPATLQCWAFSIKDKWQWHSEQNNNEQMDENDINFSADMDEQIIENEIVPNTENEALYNFVGSVDSSNILNFALSNYSFYWILFGIFVISSILFYFYCIRDPKQKEYEFDMESL